MIPFCTWYENGETCQNMVEGRTEYCATHGFEIRRRAKQEAKVKVVKPIKKITAKRSGETQQYAKLRREYLEFYPVCEVVECHRKSSQIHHMKGRTNDLLLDVNYFLAVCDVCHVRITNDTQWALSNGYSILRTTKNQTI